jgi:hypothetical protein
MDEEEGGCEESGICFDNASLRELRRMMDRGGIGSLCRELMERVVRPEEETACEKGPREGHNRAQRSIGGGPHEDTRHHGGG